MLSRNHYEGEKTKKPIKKETLCTANQKHRMLIQQAIDACESRKNMTDWEKNAMDLLRSHLKQYS